jgi:hypothetical protein
VSPDPSTSVGSERHCKPTGRSGKKITWDALGDLERSMPNPQQLAPLRRGFCFQWPAGRAVGPSFLLPALMHDPRDKRGRVTFVYSKLEFRGDVIAVLFDGRDEAIAIPADNVRKVAQRQSS